MTSFFFRERERGGGGATTPEALRHLLCESLILYTACLQQDHKANMTFAMKSQVGCYMYECVYDGACRLQGKCI